MEKMTWEQLVEAFAVINEPYAKAYVAAPPTAGSIERINRTFNISLPGSLVRFGEDCPSYGAWFASIGADYDSYLHILELNKAFRVEGDFGNDGKLLPPLPMDLVLINHGHDGDCDCLEIGTFSEQTKEFRIRHWNQISGSFSNLIWPTFREYLEWHVGNWRTRATNKIRSHVDKILGL